MHLKKPKETPGAQHGPARILRERLSDDRLESLAREALERLSGGTPAGGAGAADPEILDALTEALVAPGQYEAMRIARGLMASGAGMERLYLDYLAPAARRLGVAWEESRLSFADVTVGTSRIYGIMMLLRRVHARAAGLKGRHAVFAAAPGEDHVLGVQMAADLFRQHGWEVTIRVGLDHENLVNDPVIEECGLIGLSASGERSLPALIRLVIALRYANPEAFVLVGGNLVETEPALLRLTGADGLARDLPATIRRMERYLEA
ncbi:B12-binding domain-containing protein [Aestuariibius sp. 2305UL40-4]|uniref:cobalamin B12-binding domain-containing protein n=1 Tax=Aestuariibius violaceus TaxID=3234132 RepID=UPI00345EC71C